MNCSKRQSAQIIKNMDIRIIANRDFGVGLQSAVCLDP